MDTTVTIRPARPDDFAASLALRLEALRDHPDAFGSSYEELLADPQRWNKRIEDALSGANGLFFAERDGKLVGMAGTFPEQGSKCSHSVYIWGVYVRPAFRGAGVGAKLIEAAIDWCRQRAGTTVVRLTVSTHNTPAIRCYERCGFVATGTMPKMIRVGDRYVDELMMWREI